MAKPLVSDKLWEEVEPILPPVPRRARVVGGPVIPDRAVLTGIVFVLRTGTPWELLPPEMGCGSGMTCWRRLRDWHRAGRVGGFALGAAPATWPTPIRLDWSRACAGLLLDPGAKGGEKTGANPVDRGRPGTKRHLVVERGGLPLAAVLSAANVHDSRGA